MGLMSISGMKEIPTSPVIVFVHGHSEDLQTWNQLVKKLVENFRVVRYDLRRHGLTGPALDNEYRIGNYVSDLSMIVDHLGIDNFVLVVTLWGDESQLNTPWKIQRESIV